MAVSKTRAKLVDVARQLFAKKGVDDTTMNDIAVASKKEDAPFIRTSKARRISTWRWWNLSWKCFRMQWNKSLKRYHSGRKILKLIETHLDSIKMVVYRNGTLRAGFFRNIWRVEAVRKNFDAKEIKLFKQVLAEGKDKGIFDIDNVDIIADIVHYCIKGIEVPYIRGQIAEELDDEAGWAYVAKIVFGALGRKDTGKE